MWHTLLLAQWKPLFYWLPVEELIKARQKGYYSSLAEADQKADSACFVEMILEVVLDSLKQLTPQTDQVSDQVNANSNVKAVLTVLGDRERSAIEIMHALGLKHRPSFRKNYLRPALEMGLIEMTIPEKPQSRMQKYRKKKG